MTRFVRLALCVVIAVPAGVGSLRAQSYAVELPGVERSTFVASAPGATWVGRGRLAIRGKEWLFAYVRGNNHGGTDASKRIHLRFSPDEGRSWTEPDTLPSGGKVAGFPVGPGEDGVEAGELDLIECPNGDLLLIVREMLAVRPTRGKGRPGKGMRQFRSADAGRSWQHEGKPMAEAVGGIDFRSSLDHCVVGQAIYALVIVPAGGFENAVQLLRSTDNGRTWVRLSAINSSGELIQETGIAHLGGSRLMAVGRTVEERQTLMSISEDLGKTWGGWVDIAPQVGVTQQPNLVPGGKSGRLYLVGRLRKEETVQRNGVWWTEDAGKTWRGGTLDERDFIDSGYGDMRQRTDGSWVYLAYRGKDKLSDLIQYAFRLD